MFEGISDEIKLKAVLKVVRNLIKNSRNAEIFKLEEIMKSEGVQPPEVSKPISKEEVKEKLKEKIAEEVKVRYEKSKGNEISEESLKSESSQPRHFVVKNTSSSSEKAVEFAPRRVLRIPSVSLPSHLRYIKPVASEGISIDLGKLNPFIKDKNVLSIETEGENEIVYVSGSFGRKPTNVKLSRVEIDEVINRFSKESKIPKNEGLFKVAVGKLLITATISESVSSRFIIEKIRNEN